LDETMAEGRGYYSRGYLPHIDQPGLVQFVTFRLADAVPAWLIDRWREELAARWPLQADQTRSRDALRSRLERYADSGQGSCRLTDPRAASAVAQTLLHHDGPRYDLLAWAIMPSHVHAVVQTSPEQTLSSIVAAWKSCSARRVNAALGRRGPLWQRDYYDRYVRDDDHLARVVAYTEANPVAAGLVDSPEEWAFSSASHRHG
jgi:putative transposase